jgi:beta-galactosidase
MVNGARVFLFSGSVHYPRVHPSRWAELFKTFHEAFINTLETYVFWGEHQPSSLRDFNADPFENPQYDFEGRRDLFAFLQAAHNEGLFVILRIGPYVCAEASYGGFPFALRDVPGMRFRTLNAPFQREVARWVRFVATELHARKLMAPEGGPVILVQLENEYQMVAGAYGDEGHKYLQWCADLQHELDLGVPTIMCYGAAEGTVETINSFYGHELVEGLRKSFPNQPPVWTECWTGWYDVWGAPHHRRPTEDLCAAVARFCAVGGAGINYYMWLGGTNFGRTPMYLQATTYDYDAPVDEFYLETTKFCRLRELHRILTGYYLFERREQT